MDNFSHPRGPAAALRHAAGSPPHLTPADPNGGRTGGPQGRLSFVSGCWRQIPRIKKVRPAKWRQGELEGTGFPTGPAAEPESGFPGIQRPDPPGRSTSRSKVEATRRGEASTSPKDVHLSKWTPAARVFQCALPPAAPTKRPFLSAKGVRQLWGSPSSSPGPHFPGRHRSARGPPRHARQGLPHTHLFVAERGDPRLPVVELLLEVAVLQEETKPRAQAGATRRSRPKFPARPTSARGGGAVPRGAAYLWLPPHRGSSRAGRGPRPPGGAPRAAPSSQVGCACEAVRVCVCVPGEGGGTKSQVNTASPCRAKLINIQVAS